MSPGYIVVSESAGTSGGRAVPAGMAHLAPARDPHVTLCGQDVPYAFTELDTLAEAMASGRAAGFEIYPCSRCGAAVRGK